jgi:hypothetical protein
MSSILLCTINARYVHASLGLRYLAANMGALRGQTRIVELVLGGRAADVAEQLLAARPRVIAFGVYIWNVEETTKLVAVLRTVAPDVCIVVGGPEVSYETADQRVCTLADYVITGWGDLAFPELCASLLAGERPQHKLIAGGQPPLERIRLPYREYTDEDIARRFVYVEASRGCPFKCEFCLSSLDKTAWPFDIDAVMRELEALYDRGARHFRFVDRTFNLKAAVGARILEFFLARLDDRLFVHFEVIPDHLPDRLKQAIARFPPGTLQFEVGIQTWNPEVQKRISRRQNNDLAAENLRWLRAESNALVHVDLIAGLPGEDIESFARGFDHLYALRPHEIQVGILKRLRGAPIARHTHACAMRYNADAPYNVLQTDVIGFHDMQRLVRFARYWEMVANSGRFPRSLRLLADAAPFARFMRFADWLYAATGKTHEIALERLYEHMYLFLTREAGVPVRAAGDALLADYADSGARGRLSFMPNDAGRSNRATAARRALRQVRHLQPLVESTNAGDRNG